MDEEVGAFVRLEEVEQFADALPQSIDRALLSFAQVSFEFGNGLLDRVEVGGIGRQVSQLGAGRLDDLAHRTALVRRQIVHHDDIAGRQGIAAGIR